MGAKKFGIVAITYTHTGALSKPPIQSCDYTLRKLRKHDGTFLVDLRDQAKRSRFRGTVVERDAEPILEWLEKGKSVMCTVLQAVPAGGGEGWVAWDLGVKAPGVGRGMKLLERDVTVKVKVEDVGAKVKVEDAWAKVKVEDVGTEVKREQGGRNPVLENLAGAAESGMQSEHMEQARIRQVEDAMRGVKIEEDMAEQEMRGGTLVKVEEAMGGMKIKDEIDSQEGEL